MVKFSHYYKPYRRLLTADLFCAAAAAAVKLALPLCARRVIDIVTRGGAFYGDAAQTGAVMLALIALRVACSLFYDYKGHDMGAKMERDLRGDLFNHYQKLPLGFFDKRHTGDLLSRLNNDLNNLAELFHHGPENLFVFGAQFIGTAVILLGINQRLALAVFLFLPPMAACSWLINRRLKKAYARGRECAAALNTRAEDNLQGIRTVKSFCAESLEAEKFAEENNRRYKSLSEIYRLQAVHSAAMNSLFSPLILAVVVLLGAARVSQADLNLPDLLAFVMYISYLTEPLPVLSFLIQQFQEGMAGYNRFLEIMRIPPETAADYAPQLRNPSGTGMGALVEFRNVSFSYNDGQDVLKNLSFTASPGDIVAVAGPSGIGKTTLVSLIPRFYGDYSGQVLIDGADTRGMGLASLRGLVGIVPQDNFLFAGTVLENIRYGRPDASRGEIEEAARAAAAHEFITALPDGYDTDIGQRGVRLSGGQCQRLNIARAFLKNPGILIFDEATSALDYENERAVLEGMRRLSSGRTTFIIAHRMSTIRAASSIIMLARDGSAEQGTHEELLKLDGAYARFCSEFRQ
ncbi:MAG: ABC transporter ATP-binding protein/permease [Clostridiales bacterium]|nr:ABC transporter ATP-binding protein/permease [Clostridiales bacterium]